MAKGLKSQMERVEHVMLECQVKAMYEGSATQEDVIAWFQSKVRAQQQAAAAPNVCASRPRTLPKSFRSLTSIRQSILERRRHLTGWRLWAGVVQDGDGGQWPVRGDQHGFHQPEGIA